MTQFPLEKDTPEKRHHKFSPLRLARRAMEAARHSDHIPEPVDNTERFDFFDDGDTPMLVREAEVRDNHFLNWSKLSQQGEQDTIILSLADERPGDRYFAIVGHSGRERKAVFVETLDTDEPYKTLTAKIIQLPARGQIRNLSDGDMMWSVMPDSEKARNRLDTDTQGADLTHMDPQNTAEITRVYRAATDLYRPMHQ